jgi:hypothetical protein
MESAAAQRVLHPPSSPDLALSDFFLFGYRKEKLCGTSITPNNDLIFGIRQIFSEIPEMVLKNA